MNILSETRHAAEFVFSMANGHRSVEAVTVDATGASLEAGTIMGLVTATNTYVRQDLTASDGSEAAAGIIYNEVDEDFVGQETLFVRDGEVIEANLIYADGSTPADIQAAKDALAALGIHVRTSVTPIL